MHWLLTGSSDHVSFISRCAIDIQKNIFVFSPNQTEIRLKKKKKILIFFLFLIFYDFARFFFWIFIAHITTDKWNVVSGHTIALYSTRKCDGVTIIALTVLNAMWHPLRTYTMSSSTVKSLINLKNHSYYFKIFFYRSFV